MTSASIETARDISGASPGRGAMPPPATHLFLLEDLEDTTRTRKLAGGDLNALHAVADWIKTFVARPHKDLGRAGPVCPFVSVAWDRKTLWLASERIADRTAPEIVQLVNGYKRAVLDAGPIDGDDVNYKSVVVVFTDLPADHAKEFFDDVLRRLAVSSYVEDGLVLGAFYQRNEGSAIYNPDFHPFTPPVPFLLVRHAVIGDWKFFLDKDDWLQLWARRYPESAVLVLAQELRRQPWRASA